MEFMKRFRFSLLNVYNVPTVVSVKIKKEVKEELEKAGINLSKEVKKMIEYLA